MMFATADVLYLCPVDVDGFMTWSADPDFARWPQQHRLADGALRPAMLPVHDSGLIRPRHTAVAIIEHVLQVLGGAPWNVKDPQSPRASRLFSVVMPGHRIERHADEQEPAWVCRVHVPILTNTRATFRVGGDRLHLGPVGHAFAVNARAEHEIVNEGATPRLHLMFDVVGG